MPVTPFCAGNAADLDHDSDATGISDAGGSGAAARAAETGGDSAPDRDRQPRVVEHITTHITHPAPPSGAGWAHRTPTKRMSGRRKALRITDLGDTMRIVIIGGRARTALLATDVLVRGGHEVIGTVRAPSQAADLRDRGALSVALDLAVAGISDIEPIVAGADAVVYAAASGHGSSDARKAAIDRDAAIAAAAAAESAGVPRFVMISSMGADAPEAVAPGSSRTYLRLKAEADADLRARRLDWTIVRPSRLTDDPGTGHVQIGQGMAGGSLPRQDLAALVARILTEPTGMRRQFDVSGGTGDHLTRNARNLWIGSMALYPPEQPALGAAR